MRAAERRAERMGGRLDPPLVVVLDEAANICRISDLPDLYSHLGSRGYHARHHPAGLPADCRRLGRAGHGRPAPGQRGP